LLLNAVDQIIQVGLPARFSHDQRCTRHERRKELPDGRIKTKSGFLQDPIIIQRKQTQHPIHVIADAGVRNPHSLRLSR
jgi:hypothetical protein